MNISKKIAFLRSNFIRFNKNVKDRFGYGYVKHWLNECYCAVRFGASPDDYFRYEFYKKSNYERDKFITYRRSKKIIQTHNDKKYVPIFQYKTKFNEFFHEFIHREWIDIDLATPELFLNFVSKHGSVIMKPKTGGQGKGIFKLCVENLTEDALDLGKYQGYIAEQILQQHPAMQALNPSSVNTVRVLTFKGKIIACALRTGGEGAIVDNLHSQGVCAHVNLEYGVIDAPCIDMNFNKYIMHPVTGAKMLGFEIPNWELVKKRTEEAAGLVPDVPYVGWDICVLDRDIALIEGNHDPGHDVVQMITQTGLFDSVLEMKKRKV